MSDSSKKSSIHTIWHRINDKDSATQAARAAQVAAFFLMADSLFSALIILAFALPLRSALA